VFVLAAAGKLRDRDGTRDTLEAFGMPVSFATPGAVALPGAELIVAGLLLFDATAVAGALGALVLLGAFTAAITFNLAQGRRPDCNCFGQLHSRPVGPGTLARNATLAILAGLVLVAGNDGAGATALDDVGGLDTATGLAAGALALSALTLALVAWMAMHLLRQQGRVLLRLDALDGGGEQTLAPEPAGLPIGAPAPAFELAGAGGETVTLAGLITGDRPLALAFVDPDCKPCRSLLPDLAARNGDVAVVISRAAPDAARALAAEHELPVALLDEDGAVASAYDVGGTPMAVSVGPDSLIRSPLAVGPDAVRGLLDGLGDSPRGDQLPDLDLEDLDGTPVSLRDAIAGAPHLLLFWSPTCGYCDAMLEDVRALEERADLPPVLVIATGDPEANREQGLRSRTLLDTGFAVTGEALGVDGTPTALRLDTDGRVLSRRAVGVDQVLALAGGRVSEPAGGGEPSG
jgi:peroxiredoxin